MIPPGPSRAASHGALLALLLTFVALTTAYATIVPPFEGPDSAAHLRYVAWLQEGRGRPPLSPAAATESHELVYQPPLYYALAAGLAAPVPIRPALTLDIPNPHWPEFTPRATLTPPGLAAGLGLPARLAALAALWGGLLAIVATWGSARNLVPIAPGFALAAAAVVGLNPQFVFAAATVTNDTWAAGASALAVWLACRAWRRQAKPRAWLVVGAGLGLAMLAKYSAVLTLVPVGVIGLAYGWRRGTRAGLQAAVWLLAGVIPIAGAWYGENWLRWGSAVPADRFRDLLPLLYRPEPLTWSQALGHLPWYQRSYWGNFGYGVAAPAPYPLLLDGLILLAIVGLAVMGGRWLRSRSRGRDLSAGSRQLLGAALVSALWLAPTLLALLAFSREIRFGLHGRLLFPAAGAIGLLVVAGWTALTPAGARNWLRRVIPIGMAALTVWQLLVLRDAYAMPPPVGRAPVTAAASLARFADHMALASLEFPAGKRVQGASGFPVKLTWYATAPISGAYRRVVALVDADGQALAQVDGVPVDGRHPTQQWRPSEMFSETVVLDVPPIDRGEALSVAIRFYDPESNTPAPVLDGAGRPAGDQAVVGRLRLVGARDSTGSCPPPDAEAAGWTPGGQWENGLILLEGRVSRPRPGERLVLDLTWTTTEAIPEDLTVFVHVLDQAGQILAQSDHRPRGDHLPTDTWLPCEVITDSHELAVDDRGWDRIIAGWYRSDLSRVRLREGADHVTLDNSPRQGP